MLGKLFFKLSGELMHVRGLAEFLNLFCCSFDVYTCMLTKLLKHLQNSGEFLFGEHADLKI